MRAAVLLLAAVAFLPGCPAATRSDPPETEYIPCPDRDAPLPEPWVEPSDPGDLRTYPEPFAANRERSATHREEIRAYNASRADCAEPLDD